MAEQGSVGMSVFALALLLAEITTSSEGALTFKTEPPNPLYFRKGTDAVFEWDVDSKMTGWEYIVWEVENSTSGKFTTMMYEDENGNFLYHSDLPPAYKGRVYKKDRATLVVENITFDDSVEFRCMLQAKVGVNTMSDVQLYVTGPASVSPLADFSEVGGSATFTCNATAVPSQNFTWFWMDGDKRSELKDDGQNVIISSDIGSSQLVLKNVRAGDERYYLCEAKAPEDQPSSSKGYLQLPHPLKQDEKSCPTRSFPVATGENLTICCPVSRYPPPTVTWEKDGIQLQKGESTIFTITSVDNKDFGNYSCTASDLKTSLGPFFISVRKEFEDLPVNYAGETAEEAAKLEWKALDGAKYSVVEISGTGVYDDYFVGKTTSLELHYHTFVFKDPKNEGDEIGVCANVTTMGDDGILGKNHTCFTVKSNQATVQASLVCLLLLLSVSWKIL